MEEAIPCRVWLRDHALTEESPLTGRRGMATGERPSRTGVSPGVYPGESPTPVKAASRRPGDLSATLPRISIPAHCADRNMRAARRRFRTVAARNTRCRQTVNVFASLHLSLSLFRGAASPARLISLRPRPTRLFAARAKRWLRMERASWGHPGSSASRYYPIAPHRGNPEDARGMLLLQSTNPLMWITP